VRKEAVISEFMLIVTSVLLFSTISALFFYYRRIVTLRQEYSKAKGIIDEILLSIDNQFKRQKNRFVFVAQKIEDVLAENKEATQKVEEYEEKVTNISKMMCEIPSFKEKVSGQIQEIYNEVEVIKEAQQKVMKKLVEIEKIKEEKYVPEVKIDAAIPIKKEKALEPLTETELTVLEIISRDGEKTAPEIREKISLTREHTARLMKKLYKDGYLERDTHKMPYIYRLKEEMEKLLREREANSP
jgi:DNA-binding MarR family transcriptional regulator